MSGDLALRPSDSSGSGEGNKAVVWPRLYADASSSTAEEAESRKRGGIVLVSIASAVAAACATVIIAVFSAGGLTVLEGVGPVRQNTVYSSRAIRETDAKTADRAPLVRNGYDGRLAWTHPAAPLAWSRTSDPNTINVLVASHGADSCWQTTASATKTAAGYEINAVTGLSSTKFFKSAIELSRGFEKGCAGYIDCEPAAGADFYLPSCRAASEAISETSVVNSSMPKRNGPEPLHGVQVYADYDVVRVPVHLPGKIADGDVITGVVDNGASAWLDETSDWMETWRAKQSAGTKAEWR